MGGRGSPSCGRRRDRHRFRGPRRLFWRVYAYGLLLLVAVTVASALAGHLLSAPSASTGARYRNIAAFIDGELSVFLDRPAELDEKLERIHRAFEADVAIYGATGELIASAGETPAPLEEVPTAPRWIRNGATFPIDGGRAYAVAHFDQGGSFRWLIVPLVVLGVLALVTLPLARNIVRPIEKVTHAAQALGGGQLDARSGVKRRDEVGALAAAFDDMAARLERLVAGEKELRANVSHELRTPLARMRVALEIAEEGAQDPHTLQKHLRGIRGDIEELEELVDQVLITARLDLGNDEELALRQKELDLAEVAASSAKRFRETHREHELELVPAVDAVLVGDAKLIKRVIDNLLENSAKYASPADGPISMEIRMSPSEASLTVTDHGVGVAPDDIDRLFEPFFRADSIRSTSTKGVGLGLSFCKRVVEAHGGRIQAQPRPEGGLSVSFSLPRRR